MGANLTEFAEKLFSNHSARFFRKEKTAFLECCKEEFKRLGYSDDEIMVQRSRVSQNLVVGAPNAEYLFTAHYDTPGRNGWMLFLSPLVGQVLANIILSVLLVVIVVFAMLNLAGDTTLYMLRVIAVVSFVALLVSTIWKNKNNYNDNTSGVFGVMRIAALVADDAELRKKCAFVMFDNEEWGLLGSNAFAKWRKKNYAGCENNKVINLDCIGNGDVLLVAATKQNELLNDVTKHFNNDGFDVQKKKSELIFLSDHASFECSVGIFSLKRSMFGSLYIPKIHSRRDKVCDIHSIERLTNSIFGYIKNLIENKSNEGSNTNV